MLHPLKTLNLQRNCPCISLFHHTTGCLPSKQCLHRVIACCQQGKANGSSGDDDLPQIPLGEGNDKVQEALADILQMSIRKEEVKQQILDDLEIKKEKLRLIGEEITEDFERKINLDKMRMDLATSVSMAETMEKFRVIEEEVQAVRDRLKADSDELEGWEIESASSKNQGLFFRTLYEVKNASNTGDGTLDKEAVGRLRESIKEPARREIYSPLRLYMFTYLAAILGVVVAQDVAGGSPSIQLDILYGVLGLSLGVNAWSERQALTASAEEMEGQVKQPPPPPSGGS